MPRITAKRRNDGNVCRRIVANCEPARPALRAGVSEVFGLNAPNFGAGQGESTLTPRRKANAAITNVGATFDAIESGLGVRKIIGENDPATCVQARLSVASTGQLGVDLDAIIGRLSVSRPNLNGKSLQILQGEALEHSQIVETVEA